MAGPKLLSSSVAAAAAVVLTTLLVGQSTAQEATPAHSASTAEPSAAPPPGTTGAWSVLPSRRLIEFYTQAYQGPRFRDGRPKVSDELLERMQIVSVEQAWGTLQELGYENQWSGDFLKLHEDRPFIGRALTAQFMPSSPDLEARMTADGEAEGQAGQMNTWPINRLQSGDVYVADGFAKIKDGTLIGGNLSTDIYERTGKGVVFEGSARDRDELSAVEGFNAYVRGWHPSYIKEMMVTGINVPIRVREAVVLPGDVVMARRGGVVFIPSHLAETVVEEGEVTLLRDMFVKERVADGTYTSGQTDKGWDEIDTVIRRDFVGWLKGGAAELPVPRDRVVEIADEEEAAIEGRS